MLQNNSRTSESGNVFLFILLGVVLFAALAFVISRGFRSDTTTSMSKRQIELAVSDILAQAQQLARGVDKMRTRGISENDICFLHDGFSAATEAVYAAQTSCAEEKNRLYSPEGGGQSFKKIPVNFLDAENTGELGYGEWMFSTHSAVIGVGEGVLNAAPNVEMLATAPHLKEDLCRALNAKLGIADIPDNSNQFSTAASTGNAFTAGGQINVAELDGRRAGCFENTATWTGYVFYQVLIERDGQP